MAETRNYAVVVEAVDRYSVRMVLDASGPELATALAKAILNTHPHLWVHQRVRVVSREDAEPTDEPATELGAPPDPALPDWLSLRISVEQTAALADLVERTGQSRGALVREAIDAWLRIATRVA